MNLDAYQYTQGRTPFEFKFESFGPKGKITKCLQYTLINRIGISYFNLALGDLNFQSGLIDDLSVTNNMDTTKVLATVAQNVRFFTSKFPDIPVYAEATTSSRMRLYQMSISRYLEELTEEFEIYGFTGSEWKAFEKNGGYIALLAIRKNTNFNKY